jgi:hypothetical protein
VSRRRAGRRPRGGPGPAPAGERGARGGGAAAGPAAPAPVSDGAPAGARTGAATDADAGPGWTARLFAPVDVASLAAFRIGFGVLMVAHVFQYVPGGLFERYYLHPLVHFKFPGFGWVAPLPEDGLRLVFWGLAAAAAGIALGLYYRLCCALFCAGFTYTFLIDSALYQNHLYLICLVSLLLVFVPAHRAASLDARRRPQLRAATVPAWALWLVRFQVGVPYLFGGLAKLNHDWLVRAQPMKIWFADGSEGPWRLDLLRHDWAAYALSWGGAAFDLAVVPLLVWRRTRLAAYLVAAAFHLANSRLFAIGVFPWLMIWATLVFFPPDWPRRARLLAPRPAGGGVAAPPATGPPRRRLTVALLGLWLVVQVSMPFRHLRYAGPVDWTELGHAFSWRMKLRDKRGTVRFVAVDRASARVLPLVDLDGVLTKLQRRMLMHDPEMIRQFAHYLGDRLRTAGYPDVEVRAVTSISLNGRPPQPLVRPDVDLAAIGPDAPPSAWIAPLER